MSSTLMWRIVAPQEGESLPYQLKRIISRRLWDTDGTIGHGVAIAGPELLPYLEGLSDSGIDGANELIAIIKKHGEVELWHEQ